MVATVSDFLKWDILDQIYADYLNVNLDSGEDSDRFYIAIGRTEEWDSDATPPIPNSSRGETLSFQESIQSMKLVPNVTYVVPRYNWTAGQVYEAWDNYYGSNTTVAPFGDIQYPYYVLTDENNVFICLQQGRAANGTPKNSLFKPNDISGYPFSVGDDGYVWRYMYTVGTVEARNYLTSGYMPVERVLDSEEGGVPYDELSTTRQKQLDIQKQAVPGELLGIAIDSAGQGYTSRPDIEIVGIPIYGTQIVEAKAYANITPGGLISEIVMKDEPADELYSFGQNYHHASIRVSGGGGAGALLRAITSQNPGMGADPRRDLNSSGLMFQTTLTGVEGGDFNVENDFRQIGLIQNPLRDSAQYSNFPATGRDSAVSDTTVQAYKQLWVTAGLNADNITGDQTVTGGTSGAQSLINYYDDVEGILYVHQNKRTGFKAYDSAEQITVSEGGGTCGIRENAFGPNLRPAEVNNFSGKVIYIDNRAPIDRDDEQTEDIKIVIDL